MMKKLNNQRKQKEKSDFLISNTKFVLAHLSIFVFAIEASFKTKLQSNQPQNEKLVLFPDHTKQNSWETYFFAFESLIISIVNEYLVSCGMLTKLHLYILECLVSSSILFLFFDRR